MGNKEYIKSFLTLFLIIAMMMPVPAGVAATGGYYWETTFDCNEWQEPDNNFDPNCNGIVLGQTPDSEHYGTQITADANYPSGGGGNGWRCWKYDGWAINSGLYALPFEPGVKEIWVRWYMRYQNGFSWDPVEGLNSDKWLYLKTTELANNGGVEFNGNNGVRIWGADGSSLVANDNYGWQSIMGGARSDGSWHCYEAHFKMDTNSADGIAELWIDGIPRIQNYTFDYSGGNAMIRSQGWGAMFFANNQGVPANATGPIGSDHAYVDWDDMVISTTGYIPLLSESDTIPPIGNVSINGVSAFTNSEAVNLTLDASDPAGVSEMKVANTPNFAGTIAEPYVSAKTWTLTTSEGTKNVYVWFKDSLGNWTASESPLTASINLDTTAPTIVGTVPVNNATGVSIDKIIRVTFSEAITAGSYYTSILLKDPNGLVVPVSVSTSLNKLTVSPLSSLAGNKKYTLAIPAGAAKDLAGNAVKANLTLGFTTATTDGGPVITATNPAAGAVNVPRSSSITVSFNRNVLRGPNYSGIILRDGLGRLVPKSLSISGGILKIVPGRRLLANTRYTVTIPAGAVKDAIGTALQSQLTFNFTTGSS
ncbi:MAG: Ig-like domain-containing protein [Acidobacteriota bacterium]